MFKLKYDFIFALLLFLALFSSCAVDPEDDILAPEMETPTTGHPINAWLWAFDAEAASCKVYHTADKREWATFSAEMHPLLRVFEAGLINTNLNHSLWMANGNQIFAFTDGILDHGDHGHIVIPVAHQSISLPENANLVHHSRSASGQTVAFADDARQEVVLINVQNGALSTIPHGSAHSAAVLAGDYLITTAATSTGEKWAKIIYTASGEVQTTLEIGDGAHGDVYFNPAKTAFIACNDGIYVIDANLKSLKKKIPYSEAGRTNFMFHQPDEPLAVGLHKTDAGTSDKFLLLDLANESLGYVTIPNAKLDWNSAAGLFALAREGEIAVFSDTEKKQIYHVNLATQVVTPLEAPVAACPVAVSFDGKHVWALNGKTVSRIYVPDKKIEDTLVVPDGTDWILVTSYKTGAELFDNQVHEF
jgi:hypothetical protein